MLKFTLLLILPCLIVADTECAGGEISCPEGKTCCTVDGKPACCDPEDLEAKLPSRAVLLSTPNNVTVQNGIGDCTLFTCPQGTCCNTGIMGCCPIQFATCCTGNRCCEFSAKCCSTGCCAFGTKCCGSWCCKNSQRCGISYMTCFNAAAMLSPTTLVTLLAIWFAVYVVTKV